jgi:hypothetical protein
MKNLNEAGLVVEDLERYLSEQELQLAKVITPGASLIHLIKHERNTKKSPQLLYKPQLIPCVVDKVTAQDAFVLLGEKRLRKQVKQCSLYIKDTK